MHVHQKKLQLIPVEVKVIHGRKTKFKILIASKAILFVIFFLDFNYIFLNIIDNIVVLTDIFFG